MEASGNATLRRQWALLEPFARTYLTSARSGIDLMLLARRHRKIRSHGFTVSLLPVKWVGTTAAPVRAVAILDE